MAHGYKTGGRSASTPNKKIETETKVYPLDIAKGTSHFVGYDIRKMKWKPNQI